MTLPPRIGAIPATARGGRPATDAPAGDDRIASPGPAGVLLPVLLLVAGAIPLVVARVAPLQDWPNHLARIHVLRALLDGDPFWAQLYDLNTFLLPNVALDLGVWALAELGFGVRAAGTVFLLFTYALFVSGFLALARACSAASAAKPALAVVLFYAFSLFWGFVNYTVGLAAAFWVLAFYAAPGARIGRKLAVAVLGAAVVAVCHIIAAVVLVVLLACHDAADAFGARRHRRRALRCFAGAASAGLVVAVLLALSPTGPASSGGMIYSGHGDLLGMVKGKIVAFARAFLGGSVASDVVVLALVALALGLVPFVRRVRVPAWAALGAAALFAVALVAPRGVGGGYHLDSRLAASPVLIAAAAARFEWRRAAAGRAAYALLAVGAFARVGVLALDWSRAGSAMDDLDSRLAALPAGGVLLTGTARPMDEVGWWEIWSPPAMHVAALAVPRGVFVPSMFALPSQQPLVLKPHHRRWVGVQPVTNRGDLDRLREDSRPLCDARLIGAEPTRVYVLVQFARPASAAGPAWPPGTPLPHGFTLLDLCGAPG